MQEYGATCYHAMDTNGRYVPPPTASDDKVTRYVVLDSRDRNSEKYPSPNQYVFTLPETFYNVTCARLLTAEMPASFFVFTADRGNTSMTVILNGTSHTVTIENGNYSFTTMATALKSALEAAFAGSTFTVTFNGATLKCSISTSNASDVIAVDTTGLSTSAATQWGLAYYLGFQRDVVAQGTGSITAPGLSNMNPELYVMLDIEELGSVVEAGIEGSGGTQSNRAFAKIPLNVSSFQYSYFDKAITANYQAPPVGKLNSLHIRWRFHDGTLVDFQGAEHSLTLELQCQSGRSNHR